jgi:iron complex outermembrane receptor protein
VIPADTDVTRTGWGMSQQFADVIGYDSESKPGVDNESWGGSTKAFWFFDNIDVSNLVSYDKMDRKQLGDWDASEYAESNTYFESHVKVLSNELKFSSIGRGPWSWVAGVYYSKQKQDEIYASDFIDVYGMYARVTYEQEVESISGFGQVEYAVTEQLNLIAGLRYEYEKRELQGFGSAYGGATALPPTTEDISMTPLTGKIGFEYDLSDRAMLYASFSKGVKSGGFTTYNTGDSSAIQPFKEETLWAYEVGIKSEPTSTLTVNASAFFYDYRDQQVLDTVYNITNNSLVGRFANAPKAEIYGAELDMVWAPITALTITQNLGWKSGEYKEYESMDVAATRAAGEAVYVDRAGQKIAFPKLSYGGSLSYGWTVGGFRVSAETNYSYRDEYPSWLGHTYDVDDYWLVNASIGFAPIDGHWSLTFWGRNILDEEYDLTRNFFVNANVAQSGAPATYGIRFKYDY